MDGLGRVGRVSELYENENERERQRWREANRIVRCIHLIRLTLHLQAVRWTRPFKKLIWPVKVVLYYS
jgi:hypothetical protein